MKPCPFCGSDDVGYAYRTHPDGRKLSMISCSNCGASGPVRTYASEWDDDESEASWDKRHNSVYTDTGVRITDDIDDTGNAALSA